jgi:hypothetical protein
LVLAICKAPLYTRSQGPKKLEANFEHFWVANWLPKLDGILFQPWGQYKAIKLGQIEFFFSISALTPSVKPLGLISTLAPIGMLDLG